MATPHAPVDTELTLGVVGILEPAFDGTVFPILPAARGFTFFWTSTVASGSSAVGTAVWTVDVTTGELTATAKASFDPTAEAGSIMAVRSDATP